MSRAGLLLTLCRKPPVEFSTVRRAPETYITTIIPQNPTASIHNVALDVCIHVCESVKIKKENSIFSKMKDPYLKERKGNVYQMPPK